MIETKEVLRLWRSGVAKKKERGPMLLKTGRRILDHLGLSPAEPEKLPPAREVVRVRGEIQTG